MNALKMFAVVTSLLILSSCGAGRVNPNDAQAVKGGISVEHDDFKKITSYTGPNVGEKPDRLFIRAWKSDATGSIDYQIYVMDSYFYAWRFYDSAYDSNGNSLKTTLISRKFYHDFAKVGIYEEDLGLEVTREYLEKNQESGIRFQISGKAGKKEVFSIPPAYIKAFLSVAK
ncbi:MAG: hypothetical protein Q7J31_17230 [Syntrophales bacterium]|nr:hypothetical protein [Syntrophales bacterium]